MGTSKGIYVGGTLLSILLSLYLFTSGRRETPIFGGCGPLRSSTWARPFGGRQSLDPLELSVLLGESCTIRCQRDQPELLVAFRPFFCAF